MTRKQMLTKSAKILLEVLIIAVVLGSSARVREDVQQLVQAVRSFGVGRGTHELKAGGPRLAFPSSDIAWVFVEGVTQKEVSR
jgi:hypothetical protein